MLRILLLAVPLLALVALYLAPALVARYRGHRQMLAITVLTVVGGWSLIGWVVALVWACTGDIDPDKGYRALRNALEQQELEQAADRLRMMRTTDTDKDGDMAGGCREK